MGYSAYSDKAYTARTAHRAATNTPAFAYDAAQAAKPIDQRAIHDKLNPTGVKIRESRDSATHPDSRAVAVFCDITGSMGAVPRTIQANLPKLMGLLIRNGYLTQPHIMIGGIGDANTDQAILQVGQFESGIEIDDDLTNLWLEGNGGGQKHESYELALYFMARHTSIDCFEKRGQKGYIFIIGDEMPYPAVLRNQVSEVIGDGLEADITTAQIVAELQERYEVFFERALKLEEPAAICELIASTIGLCEGTVDIASLSTDLVAAGSSTSQANAVSKALVAVGSSGGPAGTAVANLPDSGAGSGISEI